MDNNESFVEILNILEGALKKKSAIISFKTDGCTLKLDADAEKLLDKYQDCANKIMEEILNLLPSALSDNLNVDNNDEISMKVDLIRAKIISDEIYKRYYLVREPIGLVFKSLGLKPIIKPSNKKRSRDLVTGIIKMQFYDDITRNAQIEVTHEQLTTIIKQLNDFNDRLLELEEKIKN